MFEMETAEYKRLASGQVLAVSGASLAVTKAIRSSRSIFAIAFRGGTPARSRAQ